MTAEEHARIFLELGYAIFSERYNIGYWPWELATGQSPESLFGLVDEVGHRVATHINRFTKK